MNIMWAMAAVMAVQAEVDPSEVTLSPTAKARAISLQVRGVVPTLEELMAIQMAGTIEESLIDEWLESPEFEAQIVRHHQSIFWNAAYENDLEVRRILFSSGGLYYRKQASQYSRGLSRTSCTDWENTDVNQWNQPQTVLEQSYIQNGQTFSYLDEGWVWVTPYWDPSTPIKVCAFDARTNLVSETGVDCRERASNKDSGCGCGPNLEWCMTRSVQTIYKEAFAEELSIRVKRTISEERPYTNILTEDTTYMNGPLSFYYRNIDSYVARTGSPAENIPEMDFFDVDTWVSVETPEEHSGALTSTGWLLRHQTNRGRASRFYEGFLCSTFVPPTGGIIDEGVSTPDLSLKRGCADCHARLEPWRAYWGRWKEVSSQYVTEADYPTYSETCAECAENGNCNNFCRNNYMVDTSHVDNTPYIGWYLPYAYLKQEQAYHPDDGPSVWVNQVVADGSLAQCVTQNAVTWLYGWEAEEIDADLLAEWTQAFEQSGYDYTTLVKTLLVDEVYGRRQ
jgi:hypothetical protein